MFVVNRFSLDLKAFKNRMFLATYLNTGKLRTFVF